MGLDHFKCGAFLDRAYMKFKDSEIVEIQERVLNGNKKCR